MSTAVNVDVDATAPGKVVDLAVVGMDEDVVMLQFTGPGDDLDSEDSPAEYTIKFSTTLGNLTEGLFDESPYNFELEEMDLINTTLSPQVGGSTVKINVKRTIFDEKIKYFLALKSTDEVGNVSPVSNRAQVFMKNYHEVYNKTTTPPLQTTSTVTVTPEMSTTSRTTGTIEQSTTTENSQPVIPGITFHSQTCVLQSTLLA